MKSVFAYIRVSTQKQGTQGSSLQEQRAAIEAYAKNQQLAVVEWFVEVETAAKRGRPVFGRLLKALGRGKVPGVIIHKIDRSARNPRDWADLGDLIDRGVDVHFAHESLDLHSRGGRLAADIQAVVAADFIRNLRDETKKGFYGRLKQGLYPMRAPIGYLDMGRGKAKEIDPVQGPLVRKTFELYATGEFNFETLQVELDKRGLRGRVGNRVSKNGLTTILNNPFYAGIIHIGKTNETFQGVHTPLIVQALYDRVQTILRGNRLTGPAWTNDFLFRRLIRCGHCGRRLIAERQKGQYVYYRCHHETETPVSIPETAIDAKLKEIFKLLQFAEDEIGDIRDLVAKCRGTASDEKAKRSAALAIQIAKCDERLVRLTDAFLDATVEKDLFESRKVAVLQEKRRLRDQLAFVGSLPSTADMIAKKIELAEAAYLQYESGNPAEKRDMVVSTTSNFIGTSNYPVITLLSPFQELVDWRRSNHCDPHRENARNRVNEIWEIFMRAAEAEIDSIQPTLKSL